MAALLAVGASLLSIDSVFNMTDNIKNNEGKNRNNNGFVCFFFVSPGQKNPMRTP